MNKYKTKEKKLWGLKTVCDKKHANKHQVKEDQTHMPLPPEGTQGQISDTHQCDTMFVQ